MRREFLSACRITSDVSWSEFYLSFTMSFYNQYGFLKKLDKYLTVLSNRGYVIFCKYNIFIVADLNR